MFPRFRAVFAPVLLIVIAAAQIVLARAHALTPWKGGGFGMFSTVDSRNARFLRTYVRTEEGERPVQLPQRGQAPASRLKSLPTHATLVEVAQTLTDAVWVRVEEGGSPQLRPRRKTETMPAVHIQAARAELWRYHFDVAARRLKAVKLDEVVLVDRGVKS
jgi:hypothetical protein